MARNSHIQWTDHTFNPWTGCTKVSPGCLHCYAESWSKRSGIVEWGKGKPRRRTSTQLWNQVRKWNREASFEMENLKAGVAAGASIERPARPRVFCASLADWLDDEVPIEWLKDLLCLIAECPALDFLLLTKRPQNFAARIAAVADGWQSSCELAVWWDRGVAPENVWLGTTVEDQARADDRIWRLLLIPAKIRFLSCEPLLGRVDLIRTAGDPPNSGFAVTDGFGRFDGEDIGIHWVIAGGESGPGCRPMDMDWAQLLKDQCAAAGVAFFMKQLGGASEKRGQLSDFPESLRVREFPSA